MVDDKQVEIMYIAGLIINASNKHFTYPDQKSRIYAASMAVDAELLKIMPSLRRQPPSPPWLCNGFRVQGFSSFLASVIPDWWPDAGFQKKMESVNEISPVIREIDGLQMPKMRSGA